MTRRAAILAASLAMAVGVTALVLYQERFERAASGGEPMAVVVAAEDLPLGTILTEAMLGARDLPEGYVEPRHIPAAEASRIIGLRVSSAVRANESLLWTDLASTEQRRDLSALVQEGMRAFTMRTDDTSSFGGLLRPGDRVDVLLTVERSGGYETAPIAQNLLVLAAGRDLGGRAGTSSPAPSRSVDQVTVSVSIEQSQTLALARRQGELSLVLRNPEDIRVVSRVATRTSAGLLEALRSGAPGGP